MPTPVSATEISAMPSLIAARTSIMPPSGVNLRALESRFKRTCFTLRSSPRIMPTRSSIALPSLIPRPLTHEDQGVVDGCGQAELRHFQLHPAGFDLREIENVVDQ